jgi:hypothetical protein
MNNLQIKRYKNRLDELEKFIDRTEPFQGQDLLKWISAMITLLVELKVDSNILSGFMKTFEISNDRDLVGMYPKIGPFEYEYDYGYGGQTKRESGYRIIGNTFNLRKPSGWIYYVRIAFVSARSILDGLQNENKIVPKFLIDLLSQNVKYSHIVSSLELIEQAYDSKTTDSLVKNSITLLDSVLDLDEKLKLAGKLSKKLTILNSDSTIRDKFSVSKEFVFALDNSRLVRNMQSVHKAPLLKYDIPFIVATSCAYLVVVFLENTLAKGDLFMKNQDAK